MDKLALRVPPVLTKDHCLTVFRGICVEPKGFLRKFTTGNQSAPPDVSVYVFVTVMNN